MHMYLLIYLSQNFTITLRKDKIRKRIPKLSPSSQLWENTCNRTNG